MGHLSVATTLSEQLTNKIEGVNVIVKDLLSYVLKKNGDFLYNSFTQLVKHGRRIYNTAYRRRDVKGNRFHIPKYFLKTLGHLVESMKIDVIISTVPLCSLWVSDYKKISNKQILLITYITDFFCHRDWLHPNTDIYLVASEYTKECLIEKGIVEPSIFVGGLPVRDQFLSISRNAQTEGRKRLLIMGGGLGLLPKSLSFYKALNDIETIETTVITGKNSMLFNRLNHKYKNIRVYGYINNIHEHMQNSDFVLTKPGCATLFEAIYAELPVIMFPPALEQEIRNAVFIKKNGLGIILSKKNRLSVAEIRAIVRNDQLHSEIQKNMQSFKATINNHILIDILRKYRMKIK